MLARWVELLPLFVVRLMARRWCERLELAEVQTFAMPRPGVLVIVPKVRAQLPCGCLSIGDHERCDPKAPACQWRARLDRIKHPDAISQSRSK